MIDIIGCTEKQHAFGEAGAGVLRSLEQAWNGGGLEHPEQAGPGVDLGKLVLVWPQAPAELALPLGVLDFERVQRSEQRFGLGFAAGNPGPVADVLGSRRLPA